jgi:bifunctional ADP-heptose synthase (sugar kinase/adenylyltransferase)
MLLSVVHNFIKQSSKLKIAVVGESIIDEFIYVYYEGYSMKSFCPALRDANMPVIQQEGGCLSIYNHLRNFVSHADIFSNPSGTIVKTRFIDVNDGKKHVEWNKFKIENVKPIVINCNDYDAVLVADFGHGFSDYISLNGSFYLMSQTNSNNFGFNRISKWKNFNKRAVCMDLREASLQINRRIEKCTDKDAIEIFNYELNAKSLFITFGAGGSLYTDGKNVYRHPAFKTQIVDTIGAGDTYFTFAVLADVLNLPPEQCLYIASLAASLSTTWLANSESVTPEKLLKHANQYL